MHSQISQAGAWKERNRDSLRKIKSAVSKVSRLYFVFERGTDMVFKKFHTRHKNNIDCFSRVKKSAIVKL